MWLMLQQDQPGDYIIATGKTHSVKQLLEIAFERVGLDYRDYVETDAELLRPAEVHHLRGDYAKAQKMLGWQPRVTFAELIGMMIDSDLGLQSQNLAKAAVSGAR
jgi:GDPmannose 4,6-dehydratase